MSHLSDELCEVRCGWPVWSSAWQRLYCTLYLAHEGRCAAVVHEDGTRRTLVSA